MRVSFHYVYGSGMHGCLFDNGPHFCEREQDAIESLVELFADDLEEGESESMRDSLKRTGYWAFRNPRQVGAQYASIEAQPGSCPEVDEP